MERLIWRYYNAGVRPPDRLPVKCVFVELSDFPFEEIDSGVLSPVLAAVPGGCGIVRYPA